MAKYPMHKSHKPVRLLPAEIVVRDALAEYNFEPDDTDLMDFAPTAVLYQRYLRFISESPDENIQPLNVQQFGVALARVFAVDRERQFRRRVNGRLTYGYAFVRGPGSVRTQVNPGRPKVKNAGPESPAAREGAA